MNCSQTAGIRLGMLGLALCLGLLPVRHAVARSGAAAPLRAGIYVLPGARAAAGPGRPRRPPARERSGGAGGGAPPGSGDPGGGAAAPGRGRVGVVTPPARRSIPFPG